MKRESDKIKPLHTLLAAPHDDLQPERVTVALPIFQARR